MNIAIYGGSFDPPHIGHEKIVHQTLNILPIDKLIVMPAYLSPFKTAHVLSAYDRLALLKLLFRDSPKVLVSDYEIKENKKSFSINSISYFKQYFKANKIYLIIGSDIIPNLDKWHQYKKLKSMVEFVVIKRDGSDFDISYIKNVTIINNIDINISSTFLRDKLDFKYIPNKIKQELENKWKIE